MTERRELPISHEKVADAFGSAPELVSRHLARLKPMLE